MDQIDRARQLYESQAPQVPVLLQDKLYPRPERFRQVGHCGRADDVPRRPGARYQSCKFALLARADGQRVRRVIDELVYSGTRKTVLLNRIEA